MNDTEIIEELITKLSRSANFFRGMCLDPRIPSDVKVAIIAKVTEIDDLCEKHESRLEDEYD